MSDQFRWAPVLPSFGGRLCPRIWFQDVCPGTYDEKLLAYYLEREGCISLFVRKVDRAWLRNRNAPSGLFNCKVEQLPGDLLYAYLLDTLGHITMSKFFLNKLYSLCSKGALADIKRWWHTADGIIFPLLLTVEDPDREYPTIDKLIKFVLENCANNFSNFISRMKSLKRIIRKDYAIDSEEAKEFFDLATYWKAFRKYFPSDKCDPKKTVQYIVCWSQTRATGLADQVMIKKSLDKMERTIGPRKREAVRSTRLTRQYHHDLVVTGEPQIPREILEDVSTRVAAQIRGETAHVSAGPNACLEATRQIGGQSGFARVLAKRKGALCREYDFDTLVPTEVEPRPVQSAQDLVSWSIDQALHKPAYVKCVRLHAVAEPSKARAITVCSLPYLVIVGVLSKILQPAIASEITRTGLTGTRNLWAFLFEDLSPTASLWAQLRDELAPTPQLKRDRPVTAMCSDLSEATDFGDLGVARQVLHAVLEKASQLEGFPRGLALLAKSLFLGKRFCFRHEPRKGYRYFVKNSGWLMGDRITKVVLSLTHEIAMLASGLHCSRVCGDDVIALSRDRKKLSRYHRVVTDLGFKVSEEDHFISSKIMFYCEEAAIPPQEFKQLPDVCVRRGIPSIYVDYPRIRLMIPSCPETKPLAYTDIGRFSLMGKETRWVAQSRCERTLALFKRATLLQHLAIPRPADVMCPFIPVELGGDGAFPFDPNFLAEVIKRKSRHGNEPEVHHRLVQLLEGKWGYRLVRSLNQDEVIHKYHQLVPKINELRLLIPPEAILDGSELLLGSLKIPGLESPERTFFRIQRAYYWHCLFQGVKAPELKFSVKKSFNAPRRKDFPRADLTEYLRVLVDSGFTFQDVPSCLVITKHVQVIDYLNMGWTFSKSGPRPPPRFELGEDFSLNIRSVENFIAHLRENEELDPKVRTNLHRYVEADSYILHQASRLEVVPLVTLFVSGDVKLAKKLLRMFRNRAEIFCDEYPIILLVHPMDYLYGFMDFYETFAKQALAAHGLPPNVLSTLVDFGALNYHQFTEDPTFEFPDDGAEVKLTPVRGGAETSIFRASLTALGKTSRWSLTTQSPDQYRKYFFRLTGR